MSVEIMSTDKLNEWANTATKGSSLVYYRGHISAERQVSSIVDGHVVFGTNHALESLARDAWHLYELGKITLVQRRIGNHDYLYIAQKLR